MIQQTQGEGLRCSREYLYNSFDIFFLSSSLSIRNYKIQRFYQAQQQVMQLPPKSQHNNTKHLFCLAVAKNLADNDGFGFTVYCLYSYPPSNLQFTLRQLLYYKQIIYQMNRSSSEDNLSSDQMFNRSCKQKIQDGSVRSEATPTIKFKTTKSQNELKNAKKDPQTQALNHLIHHNEKMMKKMASLQDQANQQEHQYHFPSQNKPAKFKFGADLVNSEEVSVDDDPEPTENRPQTSRNSRKQVNEDAKIAEQRRKRQQQKIVSNGLTQISLNILLLGKSGLGKSSFIDCFLSKNYESSPVIRSKTEKMNVATLRNEFDSFQVNLIDLPGYEEIETQRYIREVDELINQRLEAHLAKLNDKKAMRSTIIDERIHCCIYFLAGPWICEADWFIMKKIENITNIIPVIAKGDTYSTREIREFKKKVFEKNKQMKINWFSIEELLRQFHPQKVSSLLEGTFGVAPPFVIVCCTEKQYNNQTKKQELIREFRWGRCELNNENHNDFKFLKNLLMYYLNDLLIKHTDLILRTYESKKQQNSIKVAQRRVENNQKHRGRELEVNMSQSQDQSMIKENDTGDKWLKIIPIGFTILSIIGVFYIYRRDN